MKDAESLARSVEGHIDQLKADLRQIEERGVRKGQRTNQGPWEDRTEQAIHDQRNLVIILEAVLALILKVGHSFPAGPHDKDSDPELEIE